MNLRDYGRLKNRKVQSTMHAVSVDDSDKKHIEYMTESMAEVVNFDLVKREYMNDIGMSEDDAKSVDGLFQVKNTSSEDDGIYMIEFKNGNINARDIERKVRDSILIFQSITNTQLESTRNNVSFILVYNAEKHRMSYRDKIAQAKADQSKMDFCSFGLSHLKGFCFKRVFAYDQNQFERKILPLVAARS